LDLSSLPFVALIIVNFSFALFAETRNLFANFQVSQKGPSPFQKVSNIRQRKDLAIFFAFSFFEERVKKCKKYVMGCKASKGQNGYK